MDEHWDDRSARPGVLHRLLAPRAGARPATAAFVAGLVAAAAFVGSLVFDWQRVTVVLPEHDERFGLQLGRAATFGGPPGTADTLTLVYLVGMIALLGLLGAVLLRPESALRLRMGVTGVAVGLIGIVVAVGLRLPEPMTTLIGSFTLEGGQAIRDASSSSYGPGAFAAVAAIVAGTAGVWLAARPAVLAVPALRPDAATTTHAPTPKSGRPGAGRRTSSAEAAVVHVDDLSVSSAEPLDPGSAPDTWR